MAKKKANKLTVETLKHEEASRKNTPTRRASVCHVHGLPSESAKMVVSNTWDVT